MRRFWIVAVIHLVQSFFLTGHWYVDKKPTIEFIIDSSEIVMINHEVGSRIAIGSSPWEWRNQSYQTHLQNLRMVERPHDWFNILKYSKYMGYTEKIRQHGIIVRAIVYDSDRIKIQADIATDQISEFSLIRKQ
jgi:hypothetical protein